MRRAIEDAQARGADPNDAGSDLNHRALTRRFARGRRGAEELAANPPRRIKTTRKGRNFPLAKRVAIWQAILATRPNGWKQGDRAPFGAIVEAHRLAAAACAELGLPAPRYRSVYLLWHRGIPGPDVVKALRPTP